ncbi:NADH-ubiquinone oxidoreductase complex I, 21 kDa subunit-domain-containing protein [Epithele typhae]|uniref:NADH-ubiquinone oxidoreductase complex I, 21 kDa subunit-domain-containing protein n=1 Tax=Epithele typhae TaxID=378194 RepID=UPI002007FD2A|nr:NADH-ubiquinone oxidoreductase complex I, 21 kDa subunit-domain-containing protein [Epithele typhae]KAH9935912.1 NADH-ubiquinone oxidoreductase complex I, 21 kDa subunit-domain-containing protein [Epithele typhae]
MPDKTVETPFPLIDADPHAGRVIRYMRPSDYATWAGMTAAFPGLLYAWDKWEPSGHKLKGALRLGGVFGFVGGFLMAYQRSSLRFWGWTENKREQEKDFEELSDRAKRGLPLYGHSDQPEWVQGVAYRNSVFSALKFSAFPMINLVQHQHHGTDEAKYKPTEESS